MWPDHGGETILLQAVEHRVLRAEVRLQGEGVEALVLKTRRPDAVKLAGQLEGVTAVAVEREGKALSFRLWRGETPDGLLSRVQLDDPEELERWVTLGEILVVAAGGPRRRGLAWSDVVWIRRLGRVADVVDSHSLPEAADTLLRFVAPLKPEDMPPRMATELVKMASTLWSGVVLADFAGRPDELADARAQVRDRGAPVGLVDLLVERKRKTFGADHRLLSVQRVDHTEAGLQLVVRADLPGSAPGEHPA